MRRFANLTSGVSQSSPAETQAANDAFARRVVSGINGKLQSGGVMGDGTPKQGNDKTKERRITFQKPGVPALSVHALGYTVYNWTVIDVKPPATIGRSRRRPTNTGIWLEAKGADVNADGFFEPPVVATIKMWGERGQEKRRAG